MAEYCDLDVSKFGAAGDGKRDDTAAIQAAIDAAGEVHGTVLFAPGTYLCATLAVRPQVGLSADPTWSFRRHGGAVLKLADEQARCLLDLTGAIGATVSGLCLDGGRLGESVDGMLVDKPDYGKTEDTPRIERCRVDGFTGNGVNLSRIWCFTVRHCMLSHNGGCGLRVRGWDGFILDNWFSGNRRAGFGAYEENASITMTGNRVEWNAAGGIVICAGNHYNVTGNYVDRSGGPGIAVLRRGDSGSHTVSVTGNVIYRSGKPDTRPEDARSCQLQFEQVSGLTAMGNAMNVGRDDGGRGDWSPEEGIVYGALANSVIQGNVLQNGALRELMVDLGGHGEGVVVRDNPGCLFTP